MSIVQKLSEFHIKKVRKAFQGLFLCTIKHDMNFVTGSNLREKMNLVNKIFICDLSPDDSRQVYYHPVPAQADRRTFLVRELIEIRKQKADLQGFSWNKIEDMLHFACTT